MKYRVILKSPFPRKKITSYGLIVIAQDTERMIVVQRRHSVEFLLIVGGNYKSGLLPFLLSEITTAEMKMIQLLLDNRETYFKRVYKDLGLFSDNYTQAQTMWKINKDRIRALSSSINTSSNILSWSWPKGRNVPKESLYECAHREFYEEVDLVLPEAIHCSSGTLTTNYNTITGKIIESRYWIYVIDKEIPIKTPCNHPEVESRKWATLSECLELMGHSAIPRELVDYIKKIV